MEPTDETARSSESKRNGRELAMTTDPLDIEGAGYRIDAAGPGIVAADPWTTRIRVVAGA